MTSMFIRHTVADFARWKQVYDEFASFRAEYGVVEANVFRDANDPNAVIVMHQFENLDNALAFANSEDLKAAMGNAGVTSPPVIWFGEAVEQTAY